MRALQFPSTKTLYYELEYDNDTALMALSLEQLESFLHAVQVEATLYGLKLSTSKTDLLRHPDNHSTITFANGDHYRSIEAWFFRHLRRALSIKASYYARISNQRVWKAAGKKTMPSQTIFQQQFKMLIKFTTTPPSDPLHHVMFSPGYKDRIKFTKSKSRVHPARYWHDLVSQETLRAYHQYFNQHSINDVRKDFWGPKQRINMHTKFGEYLMTVPTRTPLVFRCVERPMGAHGKPKTTLY